MLGLHDPLPQPHIGSLARKQSMPGSHNRVHLGWLIAGAQLGVCIVHPMFTLRRGADAGALRAQVHMSMVGHPMLERLQGIRPMPPTKEDRKRAEAEARAAAEAAAPAAAQAHTPLPTPLRSA